MNPVDRDWLILMGPETDGSFRTIKGIAELDSHDYVSNLKPRYDNENLDNYCAGTVSDLADLEGKVSQPAASGRDQPGNESTSADDVP